MAQRRMTLFRAESRNPMGQWAPYTSRSKLRLLYISSDDEYEFFFPNKINVRVLLSLDSGSFG